MREGTPLAAVKDAAPAETESVPEKNCVKHF